MHISHQLSLFAAFASVIAVSSADSSSEGLAANRDSTIFRSTQSCPDCGGDCYQCKLGDAKTLEANTGGRAFIQALVNFQLEDPSTPISSCEVEFPAFTKSLEFPVNITLSKAASPDWDETTVTAETAPEAQAKLVSKEVAAGENIPRLDITEACTGANSDGQFSIYLGTESGRIELPSKDADDSQPAKLFVTSKDDV